MLHPFQSVLLNRDGSLLFCVVKNEIKVFKVEGNGYVLRGEWVDDLDNTPLIKEKVLKEQARQLTENASKKLKTNDGEPVAQPKKQAKVPKPGPGAPPVHQYIRNLALSRDGKLLLACTDSDKAAVIFNIDLDDKDNILKLIKRQPYPKRPNAITTSVDDKDLILADKFGDVYSMPIQNDVITSINAEKAPILGHVSMLTDVKMLTDSEGKQYIVTADRDEHIRISHYPQSFIVDKWLFGHEEFVSTICIPAWSNKLLFSAGGDKFVFSWNWKTGAMLSKFDYTDLIQKYLTSDHLAPERFQNEKGDVIEYSVAKIVTLKDIPYIAFFVEATKVLYVLKVDEESGALSLHQTLEFEDKIVSLTSALDVNTLCISLDNRDDQDCDLVKLLLLEGDVFVEQKDTNSQLMNTIRSTLKSDLIANVEPGDVYPLYHNASLRKHGEHFS
ncbi:Trm82 [Kluyveromyces lactis]|nr:Trm82 [Kluyveromyces lactis]